jgi:hypothetical protein
MHQRHLGVAGPTLLRERMLKQMGWIVVPLNGGDLMAQSPPDESDHTEADTAGSDDDGPEEQYDVYSLQKVSYDVDLIGRHVIAALDHAGAPAELFQQAQMQR